MYEKFGVIATVEVQGNLVTFLLLYIFCCGNCYRSYAKTQIKLNLQDSSLRTNKQNWIVMASLHNTQCVNDGGGAAEKKIIRALK